jgi:hypothetical protein
VVVAESCTSQDLMYDIVEAVLGPMSVAVDPEIVKAFIFGHDYPKLCRMVNEKIELAIR